MKGFTTKMVAIIFFCSMSAMMVTAATQPPPSGGVLPAIVLPAPDQPEHQTYLGIKGKQPFSIPHIDAQIVTVEIFTMY